MRQAADKFRWSAKLAADAGIIPYKSEKGAWVTSPYDGNSWWTGGFWPGLMWQLHCATGDEQFQTEARRVEKLLTDEFRTFRCLNHDVGFMYLLSCGTDAKLTGDEQAKTDTLHAASLLMGRFNPAGFIRAWNHPDQRGFAIIDCMMNLSLLWWATRETGDPRFAKVAQIHAQTTLREFLRPDGSVSHIIEFDPETGKRVKEYGGQGCDVLTYVMCVEELSKVCGTTGVIVSAHTSLCIDPIMTFGTEEQKKKYVPDLASGKKLGAFGLTEPGAGTDAQGQQTKAVFDEATNEWVLNGSKCFITNGKYADVYIVIAVTGKVEKRGRMMKEISAFIVEKGTPGFTFGTKEKKMGIRGSATYELIFEDCRIPAENLLGKKGKGFGIAMHTLDGGRIGIASQALGLAEGALETTIEYVKERKQFGRAIGQFQNTQFQLADMATKVEAAKMLVYKAARAKDTQKEYGFEAAQAKLYAAEVAMEVTTKAVQLHGGYGYIREYDVERMMRDAKITEIYEGTSEVQRMVISANLLK